MKTEVINFASDNTSGVDPEIFSIVEEAARSSAMPYGDDDYSVKLQTLTNEVFEKEVRIFPVATGSAAKFSGSLGSLPPVWHCILS